MIKICTRCGEGKDLEHDFNWKHRKHGIYHAHCKSCQSQASKKHYQANKQLYIARARIRNLKIIADNRSRLIEYLASHPCVDCGQTDIRVLEFDHVRRTKRKSIARMLEESYAWSTIEEEITKCEIRCANYHRAKTGRTNASWRHNFSYLPERAIASFNRSSRAVRNMRVRIENMQKLYTYLTEHPCVDCGRSDIRILEFDHVLDIKLNNVAELLANAVSWPRIEAEIAKCEVRCANCHRLKTGERGGWWRFLQTTAPRDDASDLHH